MKPASLPPSRQARRDNLIFGLRWKRIVSDAYARKANTPKSVYHRRGIFTDSPLRFEPFYIRLEDLSFAAALSDVRRRIAATKPRVEKLGYPLQFQYDRTRSTSLALFNQAKNDECVGYSHSLAFKDAPTREPRDTVPSASPPFPFSSLSPARIRCS